MKTAIGFIAILLAPHFAGADSRIPGRLFFNPEERSLLERQRRLRLPAEIHSLSLSGEITRHPESAQRLPREYLWLNGEIVPDRPELPDLRPGERFDLIRGERQGRISIETSRPKQP